MEKPYLVPVKPIAHQPRDRGRSVFRFLPSNFAPTGERITPEVAARV